MEAVAAALRERVASAGPWLRGTPEAEAAHKPAPERWSKKEILGHLIGSAANNHQRFVRAQLQDELTFPKYEQEGWARCQDYAAADWALLIDLWTAYNTHLAWVIERIPAAKASMPVQIVGYDRCTLGYLVEDYVVHLDHHLGQLRQRG
ncbi:MAG: DinB family protein [Gemmataceae bacterium]